MKYTSVDRLSDFEFHDSEWELVEWRKIANIDTVTFKARLLNVYKDAAPNNLGVDMEIEEATICFNNFIINENELSHLPIFRKNCLRECVLNAA